MVELHFFSSLGRTNEKNEYQNIKYFITKHFIYFVHTKCKIFFLEEASQHFLSAVRLYRINQIDTKLKEEYCKMEYITENILYH